MGKTMTGMGNLDSRGIRPLLQTAFQQIWSGVLRARNGTRMAALWFVKGHLVHAVQIEGKLQTEGPAAFETIRGWTEGAYWLEENVLPPARTIRSEMHEIIAALTPGPSRREADPAEKPALEANRLDAILETLRERVPGLESLSLTHGRALEMTTAQDGHERDWLDRQLRRYFAEDRVAPEQLFVQQGEHTLLITKGGPLSAVLSARSGTAPEALFWAAEEARKHILSAAE